MRYQNFLSKSNFSLTLMAYSDFPRPLVPIF